MSVYVDDYFAQFSRMQMSHLIADSHDELLSFIDRIGVQRKWIQKQGTHQEHFDVCKSKRLLAIDAGAIQLTPKQLVVKMREKLK